MKSLIKLALPVAALGLCIGCENMPWNKSDNKTSDAKKMDNRVDKTAQAKLSAAQAATTRPSWGKGSGTITFAQTGDKVHISGTVKGLPPGKHAIHIHEKGDLSAPDLMSAGGHYNPDKHIHGGPTTSPVHAGDLGNITADASGNAKMDLTVDDISIGGKNDILGKSVIIHEKEDDLKTQPSGNAGGRIAGGVIEAK
jgi:Cu-Zn family superoxide dismutase